MYTYMYIYVHMCLHTYLPCITIHCIALHCIAYIQIMVASPVNTQQTHTGSMLWHTCQEQIQQTYSILWALYPIIYTYYVHMYYVCVEWCHRPNLI